MKKAILQKNTIHKKKVYLHIEAVGCHLIEMPELESESYILYADIVTLFVEYLYHYTN